MPGDRAGADTAATGGPGEDRSPRCTEAGGAVRGELLTVVHPPTVEQEATRDLCRLREATVGDRKRARNRLAKFLLKWGIPYAGTNGTQKHRRWLLSLRWEHRGQQATFDLLPRAVEETEDLVRSAEQGVEAAAASDDYRDAVGILRCFRGVGTPVHPPGPPNHIAPASAQPVTNASGFTAWCRAEAGRGDPEPINKG